jgi:hypothetical protein
MKAFRYFIALSIPNLWCHSCEWVVLTNKLGSQQWCWSGEHLSAVLYLLADLPPSLVRHHRKAKTFLGFKLTIPDPCHFESRSAGWEILTSRSRFLIRLLRIRNDKFGWSRETKRTKPRRTNTIRRGLKKGQTAPRRATAWLPCPGSNRPEHEELPT